MNIYQISQEISQMKDNLVFYNDYILDNATFSINKQFLISETIFKAISQLEKINDFLEKIKEK